MKPWNYLASFSIPLFAAIGLLWGGIWSWLTVAVVFVGVPAMDAIVGCDTEKVDDPSIEPARGASRLYSWILYFHLPVQLGLILLCGWEWTHQSAPWWVQAGWVLSVALSTGGIGITVAHELIHRKTKMERWIGRLILMTVLYMHFAIQSLWLIALVSMFGWGFLGIYCAIAFLSFGLLEVVNYIEHYGLERHALPSGRLETVQEHHSWNSDHRVSRMLLFELSRHSDHHMAADRHYQLLQSKEQCPQLPSGYPGMVLLALCPPVWFWMMNPRIVLSRDAAKPI